MVIQGHEGSKVGKILTCSNWTGLWALIPCIKLELDETWLPKVKRAIRRDLTRGSRTALLFYLSHGLSFVLLSECEVMNASGVFTN